jgi:anaerobic selenocysteine-containing dehydrogenase
MISRRRFLGQCGRCALALPLSGLLSRSLGAEPEGADVERWTRSVCDLCGLGEPVFIRTREGRPVDVKGIVQSRTGFGRLCPRARAIVEAATTEDRAIEPLLRRDRSTKGTLNGLEPVSWEEAWAAVANGLRSTHERHGPGGVAIASSDGETCETYSFLARLARAGLGTDHLDTPARLDALHAYDACRQVFGTEANPGSVEDVDAAGLILLVGGDVAESHPGLYYRVLDARRTGRARVVLLDSRRTVAAAVADLHLRVKPGHELAVVNSLAAELASPSDDPASEDWRAWLRTERATIAAAVRAGGLEARDVEAVAHTWREARNIVTLVGPTALGAASGAALARAVAQLHHATGQWGGPGRTCLFLPRGANATGAVALGIRPGRLPAGGRLTEPTERDKTAAAWGTEPGRLPERPGLPLLEWPAAIENETLGAMLVLRTNLAAEMPDAGAWRRALTQAFTVASSTHVPTETTVFADVVLPLALVSGESSGTMMTLDRRCQSLQAGATPPGVAKPADQILVELARTVLDADSLARSFSDVPAEWDRWRGLAQGTPFDADGIPPFRLSQELDVPWPCAGEDEPGTARIDASSAASPVFVPTPLVGQMADDDALLLVTGPLREHLRSRVRTGRASELHYEAPVAKLEMHPGDASALGFADGDWITVESEVGAVTARLWATDRVIPGVVFLPEHFGFLSDLQGGSSTQKEPEGLAHLVTSSELVPGVGSPAGLQVRVSVRKARRRDMRRRGV